MTLRYQYAALIQIDHDGVNAVTNLATNDTQNVFAEIEEDLVADIRNLHCSDGLLGFEAANARLRQWAPKVVA